MTDDHRLVRCSRCNIAELPERRADLPGWLFVYLPVDGQGTEELAGIVCPDCCTDEDRAEVEIREATEEIEPSTDFIQLRVQSKGGGS